jgi:indolepyruvate decarboxylase
VSIYIRIRQDAAVQEIVHLVTIAKQSCILPGYLLRRYDCVNEAKILIEASGLQFFVPLQDKSVLPESHPQFGGVYLGQWNELADTAVSNYINECDCIIGLGPEKHDFNTGFYSMQHDFKSTINIMPHKTRVGMATYDGIEMKDILSAIAKKIPKLNTLPTIPYSGFFKKPSGNIGDLITYEPFFERVQSFLKPNDILVSEASISSICGTVRLQLPDGVDIEAQTSWGAIGWGTSAILGHCVAAPNRRCLILAGDGGHQMTANNMGTFYRYGMKPIFLMINNGGFLAERVTNRNPDEIYNDVSNWNYADIPSAMGCEDWYTKKVTTLGELDSALFEAEKARSGVYIEIVIDPYLIPKGGNYIFSLTGSAFGMPNRTWTEWKAKYEARQKYTGRD